MKISTKGRYGLRLMLDLASEYSGELVPLKEIAARQGLSDKYLEQIITPLNKSGLVKSVRGSRGGYKLAKQPERITVGEVLRVLEGSFSPVSCVDDNGESCERSANCPSFTLWKEIKESIEQIVDNRTLADIINKN